MIGQKHCDFVGAGLFFPMPHYAYAGKMARECTLHEAARRGFGEKK